MLVTRYPYYEGTRALHGAPLRPSDPVGPTLAMVQCLAEQWMGKDDRDSWEGWMTCSWEQAMEFLGEQEQNEADDRLSAARMIGALG